MEYLLSYTLLIISYSLGQYKTLLNIEGAVAFGSICRDRRVY
jgi:hypothetical protein